MRLSIRIATLLLLVLPAIAAAQATRIDTIYTPPGYPGGALRGTIFIPETSKGAGVVLLHGGGGSRSDLYTWCDSLAANGYVAMAISYPDLSVPNSNYPLPVRAFKTGVEFLRANASRFGITTNKIMGLGISYGALVLGQAIAADNRDDIIGTDPAIDDAVQGAVLLYGTYNMRRWMGANYDWFVQNFYGGDTALARAGNTIENLDRITAPVLLAHGTADDVYESNQSQELNDSLIRRGKQSQIALFADQGHMFDFDFHDGGFSQAGLGVKQLAVTFLNSLVAGASVDAPGTGMVGNLACRVVPNPASSQASVSFCLRQPGNVTVEVIDLLGREVMRQETGALDAGCRDHAIRLDGIPAGAYYCRVRAGNEMGLVPVVIREN